VEFDATTGHGRCNLGRATPRNIRAPRHFEKTHAEHHWWDWYAPYLTARQNGSSLAEAVAAANRYMDEMMKAEKPVS
jgi:hypothetical protein